MDIAEISPEDALNIVKSDPNAQIIDVRRDDEVKGRTAFGGVNMPRDTLELDLGRSGTLKDQKLIVMCQSGIRSRFAAAGLIAQGYTDVSSLAGGFGAWDAAGLETTALPYLEPAERDRFARHLSLSEIGPMGQTKLRNASVAVVGAGGLGSPALLYLASMGVGRLVLFDPDIVEVSNLQRQVIHDETTVGVEKVESAKARIQTINSACVVETHARRLDENDAATIADCQVILNGADNFAARRIANDLALTLGIPMVDGAVLEMEGQVSVFCLDDGPCYQCLYPAIPPQHLAPSCAEAGVLGAVPGTIGILQAVEVVKLITGYGTPLSGRVLCFDALESSFSTFSYVRVPDCAACGTITKRHAAE